MTPDQFSQLLRRKMRQIDTLRRDVLPVKLSAIALSFYRDGFRRGGFTDSSFSPWPATRRQSSGVGASAAYGPLLSSRLRLFSSLRSETFPAAFTISTDVPYAAIHNQGGDVHPRVTDRMRRFAWAMYYKAGSGKAAASPEADRWKALALTRRQTLSIHIPQRRFLAPSATLISTLQSRISSEILAVLRP